MDDDAPRARHFVATERFGGVSALLLRPAAARALLVLAHGAGAGMRHAFMEGLCSELAERRIATFRYQFPYTEKGTRRPDRRPVLIETVRSAVAEASRLTGDIPLYAGGKSMGGRMTSLAAAEEALPSVRGIAFFGFPLHPAGKPGVERAEHLSKVSVPMLFLQGTRDKLAPLDGLQPICDALGPAATLHVIDGADHSFHVLVRSGRSADEVLAELADTFASWTSTVA